MLHLDADREGAEHDEERPDDQSDQRGLDQLRGDQHQPDVRPLLPGERHRLVEVGQPVREHPRAGRRPARRARRPGRWPPRSPSTSPATRPARNSTPSSAKTPRLPQQHLDVHRAGDLPDLGVDEQERDEQQQQRQRPVGEPVDVAELGERPAHDPPQQREQRVPAEHVDEPPAPASASTRVFDGGGGRPGRDELVKHRDHDEGDEQRGPDAVGRANGRRCAAGSVRRTRRRAERRREQAPAARRRPPPSPRPMTEPWSRDHQPDLQLVLDPRSSSRKPPTERGQCPVPHVGAGAVLLHQHRQAAAHEPPLGGAQRRGLSRGGHGSRQRRVVIWATSS